MRSRTYFFISQGPPPGFLSGHPESMLCTELIKGVLLFFLRGREHEEWRSSSWNVYLPFSQKEDGTGLSGPNEKLCRVPVLLKCSASVEEYIYQSVKLLSTCWYARIENKDNRKIKTLFMLSHSSM